MNHLIRSFVLIFFSLITCCLQGQNHRYYIRAISSDFDPALSVQDGKLKYTGKDSVLKSIFDSNDIYVFSKAFTYSKKSNLLRIFTVESNSNNLLKSFLQDASHLFDYGEYLGIEQSTLASYPNDYGQTGGSNLGINANLSNYDFIDLPIAWDYTTGHEGVKIGISDGGMLPNDNEFINKITVLTNSTADQSHGVSVTEIAAGKGGNQYGVTGVCYDCDIISTFWNGGDYNRLLGLSYAGAKIINCSWGSYNSFSQTRQDVIDEIYENGSIIVASSHNQSWNTTQGNIFSYPASYNHVISVGSVGQRYDTVIDSVYYQPANNSWRAMNVKHSVGRDIQFIGNPNTDPDTPYQTVTSTTNILNTAVDIMAPGCEIFLYGDYLVNSTWGYNYMATSPAAPHVSGTLGLMYSLNGCLTFEEAESILKISSINIDDFSFNSFAFGKYGSGSLNAGRAVELTNNLIDPNEVAYIENQIFSRWDFVVKAVSDSVVIKNQVFKEKSTLELISKNSIYIEETSLLEPSSEGFILLEIDPTLTIDTNCSMPFFRQSEAKKNVIDNKMNQLIFPNPTESIFTIQGIENINEIEIYDLTGKFVWSKKGFSNGSVNINISDFHAGVYLVRIKFDNDKVITNKIIKR